MRKLPLLAAAIAATLSIAHAADDAKIVLPAGTSAPAGYQKIADYGSFALYRGNPAAMPRGVAGAQVLNEADVLQFDRLRIDTQTSAIVAPTGFALNAPTGAALHLVQFVGPLKDAWLDQVRAVGAVPVHYIESNGYLVWANAAARSALATLAAEKTVLQFSEPLPSFVKLEESLFRRLQGQTTSSGTLIPITVQMYRHAGGAATKEALAAMGLKPTADWTSILGYETARYEATLEQVRHIIEMNDVYWVGEVHPYTLNDEVQAQIIRGYFNAGNTGPQAEGYLPWLNALGFSTNPADYPIVDVTDDGVGNRTTTPGDPTMHELGSASNPSRLIFNQHCGSAATNGNIDGHGHINTNIVGGYDVRTNAATPGARFPGEYQRGQGMNPYTRLGSTRIFNSSGTFDFSACGNSYIGVARAVYAAGARISSNSWGCRTCAGTYNDSSQAYDAGTRDADPNAAGNQQLITIFAAGNTGPGATTVGTPGNGKNMTTVGASENLRPNDENGPWSEAVCGTVPADADNAMDVIAFSSRGPAPGQRIKPEVIAPGTHITGTRGTPSDGTSICDPSRPVGNATYAASTGTSHSTPAVSGVASLAWWWIANGKGALSFDGGSPSVPTPSLMKAYLLSHPTYLTGVSGNGNLPTNAQGYGMPNLQAMFAETPTYLSNEVRVLGATGETWTWVGSAVDPSKPVRIALAWTDAPGAIGTSPQVNNLDLKVEYGSSTYLGNVFNGQWSATGGTADIRNNYEAVFLPAGTPDAITITVTGFNIAGDGIPGNADLTDQDFSIVCSNCAQTPTFTLAVDPAVLRVCTADTASVPYTITAGSILGFSTAPTLSVSGAPAGATTGFSVNPVPLPGNSVLTVGNLSTAAAGTSTLTITGTAGTEVKSRDVDLTLFTGEPADFALTSPASGAQNVALSPALTWAAAPQAAVYIVEVATDAAFSNVVWSGTSLTPSVTVGTALDSAANYFWRVTARNTCGDTSASDVFSFTTIPLPGDCPVGVTPTSVYSTDFEGDNSAWTSTAGEGTALWAISGARTHSGTKAFLGQDVAVRSDQRLVSPAIALPVGQLPLNLLFWNHQTMEVRTGGCYDGALLEISTNDGSTWTQVTPAQLQVGAYTGPIGSNNPLTNLQAWCGDPQDWSRYVVNLASYAGQSVRFRWRVGTDGSVGRLPDGFYLDDVKVQACGSLPDVIFKSGFDPATP